MQNNEFQNRRDFLKLGAKVASSVALAGLGTNMLLADSLQIKGFTIFILYDLYATIATF